MNVKIDGLADAIAQELSVYSQEVTDGIKRDVRQVAKECRDEIKANSPKKSGDYAKGWSTMVNHESTTDIRITVHNRKHAQRTHLLEDGHAKANGGRVEGRPHIAPAEQHAAEKLEKKVKVTVRAQ